MIEEINDVIEGNYDTDWIALGDKNKIHDIRPELRFQKNHYGFKPKGLWLGKGNNWIEYIEANDMTEWISTYCSAFKIELGEDILVLKEKEDFINFTKEYSESRFSVDWKKVANKYNGIVAFSPRRFQFEEGLEWLYGWDITSACIWSDEGIESIDKVYDGCEDDELEPFAKGGKVTTWKNKYNKKYGYPKNESHSLKEISKDTGVSMKGIRKIYNKGIGAYKTNPSSVRPNVTSKEQWAYARVYSAVMGGKASKVDAKELKMEMGGMLNNHNFKSWFEGSKVVDEKGNPLVVYHGTGGNFDKFKDSIDGGSWFTSNPIVAEDFVFMGNSSIIPVYLSLKNPYIVDLKGSFLRDSKEIVETIKDVNEVQSDKYDGIILKNALDYVDNPIVSDIYVSFEPTQIKSAIGNNGEYDPNNPSIIMAEGGQVCTYDFDGYDLYKKKCGNDVDVYLIPAEYSDVSIWFFENEFPLWLYYNYLARITASKENILTLKTQFINAFNLNIDFKLFIEPESNKKFWKNSSYGKARSYMSYNYLKGVTDVTLVAGGEWTKKFKERTSGLNIPHPKDGVMLNTAIHEFAHVLDVTRYSIENPNEKILVTHNRGFLIALRDILMDCRNGSIPIVNKLDNKAILMQEMLQTDENIKMIKKQYGIKGETNQQKLKESFNVSVPKELKEFNPVFKDLKGSQLNELEIQEIRKLISEYKETDMQDLKTTNFKRANSVFKSINNLLSELSSIESKLVLKDVGNALKEINMDY